MSLGDCEDRKGKCRADVGEKGQGKVNVCGLIHYAVRVPQGAFVYSNR